MIRPDRSDPMVMDSVIPVCGHWVWDWAMVRLTCGDRSVARVREPGIDGSVGWDEGRGLGDIGERVAVVS